MDTEDRIQETEGRRQKAEGRSSDKRIFGKIKAEKANPFT